MSEQAKARQEACCNASETEYFGARSQIDTLMQRHNFCAGFYRGYAAAIAAAPQPSPTAQAAESVPAIQGETNVQLDTDSNPTAPGQQRDMACSLALGQPVGNGQDQAAGHLGAQGDKLLTVAERNIRSFLRSATFKSESDREAALNCVDVLWEAARDPADSVLEDAARYQWIRGPGEESTRYSRWSIEYWDGPNGWQPMQRESMDSAIDAARKQGGA